MQNKPYLWAGRFYNNRKDYISLRLSRAAWCLAGKIARKAVMRKHRCSALIKPACWVVEPSILPQTNNPVITWIGHSTFLIQVGGVNIITDPVFFTLPMFAHRVLSAGISLNKLPKIDFVIISHNHCDHMDLRSLKFLSSKYKPTILVPCGNKKWLEKRGISNVIEKTWWEDQAFDVGLKFTFLPAVHWTSRGIWDINTTLWGSWMIEVGEFRLYFAGDTAYAGHFEKIGKAFGPIDVALMPIGPVQPRKFISEAHTCPAEAIKGFLELNAKYFVPMHWGTFKSAYEGFSAPADGLLKSWEACSDKLQDRSLKLLKVGESFGVE